MYHFSGSVFHKFLLFLVTYCDLLSACRRFCTFKRTGSVRAAAHCFPVSPQGWGGGRNAAGDPGPWTGTAAGADQTDPYSLIEKFRSLYHRFCRLLDASASPRFLLRSACSDQGSGFVWTAPPFIKNNRQVTGCTRKPYPSRHPMGSAGIFLIFVSPVLSWSDRQDIPFPRERKQRKIRLRIYFWGFLCLLCHT